MLREEVLEKWNSFKKSLLDDKNFLDELISNLHDMTFKTANRDFDGIRINDSSYQVMKDLKRQLPSIVSNYEKFRNEYKNNQFGSDQLMAPSFNIYVSYIGLVETYKKIIEYYDKYKSAPTIEEV